MRIVISIPLTVDFPSFVYGQCNKNERLYFDKVLNLCLNFNLHRFRTDMRKLRKELALR